MNKIKIDSTRPLYEVLDILANMVEIGERKYNFLPFWFEGDKDEMFIYYLDKLPSELVDAIKEDRSALLPIAEDDIRKSPFFVSDIIKIVGCDKASGFSMSIIESELEKTAKKIYEEHPGKEGYYNFIKYLWIEYNDGRESVRLDSVIDYD